MRSFDRLRAGLDAGGSMDALDTYQQQAADLLLGRRAQSARPLARAGESPGPLRKTSLVPAGFAGARLVQAGVAFVTLDLSYHGASGTWDTHGDNIPPYGGITRGLGPLLPLFDHLLTTLVLISRTTASWTTCWSLPWANSAVPQTWGAKAARTVETTGPSACRWRWREAAFAMAK